MVEATQIRDYFANKPHSYEIYKILSARIQALGTSDMQVASQISFSVKRKFAWIWLYNITSKNPEGTIQILLAIDKPIDKPPVYRVTKIGKSRWNHLVVVHSLDEAKDPKLTLL